MKTGQTAPAFQFYASDVIADKRYRLMSLEERGLLISLLCECWVNKSVPADLEKQGKWLGYPLAAVKAALTERVMSFFKDEHGELISPELEEYRQDLLGKRKKLSDAGKRGAQAREEKKRTASHPQGYLEGSRVEMSGDELNRGESVKEGNPFAYDPWLKDYDEALDSNRL